MIESSDCMFDTQVCRDCRTCVFTIEYEFTCHATLAACYQLVQSVSKMGFAKKGGIGEDGQV